MSTTAAVAAASSPFGACRAAPGAVATRVQAGGRRRLRELGITIGALPTGRWNAITDVPGVRVGHCTRSEGEGALEVGRGPIRVGVTAILPADDVYARPVAAAHFVLNGNGEMTGLGNVDRRGLLESPVFLTDTACVGRVLRGALTWQLAQDARIGDDLPVPVPVVGETWGAFLHDVEGRHLTDEHVLAAIAGAQSGPVEEGAVGGGTGMICHAFKGGIGSASRVLPQSHGGHTVGVLVQTNHGAREELLIDGVPVGREIADLLPERGARPVPVGPAKTSSILLVGATDAPMIPQQLERLCRRMVLGLARTGTVSSHGSGDLCLFFSTGLGVPRGAELYPVQVFNDEWITCAHQAAREAAEEAVLDSLCMATTTTGVDGNRVHALPLERLPAIFRKYGRELAPEAGA